MYKSTTMTMTMRSLDATVSIYICVVVVAWALHARLRVIDSVVGTCGFRGSIGYVWLRCFFLLAVCVKWAPGWLKGVEHRFFCLNCLVFYPFL